MPKPRLRKVKELQKEDALELAQFLYDIFPRESVGAKIINGQINANHSAKD